MFQTASDEEQKGLELKNITEEVSVWTLNAATLMQHILYLLNYLAPFSTSYVLPLPLVLNSSINSITKIPGMKYSSFLFQMI